MQYTSERSRPPIVTTLVQVSSQKAPPPTCPLPAVPMSVYAPQQDQQEPIYMTPSEVAQGYKHSAVLASGRDHELDSVISERSSLSGAPAAGAVPGTTALEDAKHNQLKRTHVFQEKLRSWETSSGRQAHPPQNSLMMSTESGVFIEELHDYDASNKLVEQPEAGSVLRPGQLTLALDSPSGQQQVSQVRLKQSTRTNTVFMSVPHQEAWVVERMGKFHRVLEPGMNMLVPLMDRIKYVHNLKEIPFDMPNIRAITEDQVAINVDFMVFLKVEDPYQASYAVEDPEFAITQVAKATLRAELGKVPLDKLFMERERLGAVIQESINSASEGWGIVCIRSEIRDIQMPFNVQQAMILQAEAERKKQAAILEAEGVKMAEIHVAEGQKYGVLLAAEAARMDRLERADAEAEAMLTMAKARAQSLALLSEAISLPNGMNAAALSIAEQYVQAFSGLARSSNTMILPADAANPASVIAQAMSIFGAVANSANAQNNQQQQAKIGGANGAPIEGATDAASLADSLLTDTTAAKSHRG